MYQPSQPPNVLAVAFYLMFSDERPHDVVWLPRRVLVRTSSVWIKSIWRDLPAALGQIAGKGHVPTVAPKPTPTQTRKSWPG